MTPSPRSPLRVVTFGDPAGEVWGAAIDAGEPAILVSTPAGSASAGPGAVELSSDGAGWRVRGDGFELAVTPTLLGTEGAPDGVTEELCEVAGTVRVAGTDHPLRCVGIRSGGDGVEPGRLESARALSGWFETDLAVGLLALRPAERKGHGNDLVSATLFEADGPVAVADPRLSTTYVSSGRPARASLELWVGDDEEQYPRRAAAEASGDPVEVAGQRIRVQVTPLRCHMAGLDGAGVYVLARF